MLNEEPENAHDYVPELDFTLEVPECAEEQLKRPEREEMEPDFHLHTLAYYGFHLLFPNSIYLSVYIRVQANKNLVFLLLEKEMYKYNYMQ